MDRILDRNLFKIPKSFTTPIPSTQNIKKLTQIKKSFKKSSVKIKPKPIKPKKSLQKKKTKKNPSPKKIILKGPHHSQ
jgi:hypothetical protein